MIVQSPVQLHDINVAMTGQTGVIVQEGGGQLIAFMHCGVMPFQNKDCAAMPHGLICNSCFWLPVQVFSAFIAFTTHDACPCFVLASVRAAGCEYRSMQMLVWKNLPQSRAEHADKKAVKPRHNVPKKKHSAILACGPLQC